MRRWSYALGGLLAWAAHFSGVYAFASLEAQTAAADRWLWQTAAGAWSLACAAACGLLLRVTARRLRGRTAAVTTLMDQLAALGAVIGLVAIAWQALSALLA